MRPALVIACFVALLVSGCAPSEQALRPTQQPTTAPPPAAPSPSFAPTTTPHPPTAAPPTVVPPTTVPPTTVPPTAVPPTAVAATPQPPTPDPQPPTPTLRSGPFDLGAQASALLPDLHSDLDAAAGWNRYTISAVIDTDRRTLSGRQRVEYTNHDSVALERIYFHLYPNLADFGGSLEVSSVAVNDQAAPVVYEARSYLLRVDLPQPLAVGATTTVVIDFVTRTPQNASNRFYGAFNKEDGVLALASAYPIAAIVRGGTWETGLPDGRGDFVNSETALYDVTLSVPDDWHLATTGVTVAEDRGGGMRTERIVSGPQRDFMICAVLLKMHSAEVDGTTINSYASTDQRAQAALGDAGRALHVFNTRYGRYPLREVEVVEVAASTFLGVEYPGLFMIEQRVYPNPQSLETTIAHEMAHQWWYSQVGNNVQTEAWLDEALASYSQVVYREEVNGPAGAGAELETFRDRYRAVLAAGADAPVARPNTAFGRVYVALVYGKAVLFFQALREQIGDAAFDQFLHSYYASYRYRTATGADLLMSAEQACSCELDSLYRDWISTAAPVEIP